MTGTGFMKCIPITLSARLGIVPPILEIEIDDVLDARIECSGTTFAMLEKIIFFNSKSSFAASIIKSALDRDSI